MSRARRYRRMNELMDKLTDSDLTEIEARLEAFGEWYARIIDGASYDPATAMEDYGYLERDMRQLIEQVRARRDV